MLRVAITAACTLLAVASATQAQVVRGRVVLAGTETPLADVHVKLQSADGRTLASTMTTDSGQFRLHAARIVPVTVVAERIGLQPVTTSELQLTIGEAIEVQLTMSETAVPLDPLTVRAREVIDIGPLSGYYQRVLQKQRGGFGHVFTRDVIQERNAIDVVDMMREVPRMSVVPLQGRGYHVVIRGGRGTCTPKVYLNGVHANRGTVAQLDDLVRPMDLEGIEVYRGIAEMPGEYYDETHCGVILLWTRRDSDGGRPMSWKRILITLGGIGLASLLLLR